MQRCNQCNPVVGALQVAFHLFGWQQWFVIAIIVLSQTFVLAYKPQHAMVYQDWFSDTYGFEIVPLPSLLKTHTQVDNINPSESISAKQAITNERILSGYPPFQDRSDVLEINMNGIPHQCILEQPLSPAAENLNEEMEPRITSTEEEKEWIFKAWKALDVLKDKCFEYGNRLKYRYCHAKDVTQILSYLPEDLESMRSDGILDDDVDGALVIDDGDELDDEKKSRLIAAYQAVVAKFAAVSLDEVDTNEIESSVSIVRDFQPGRHFLRMYWKDGDTCEESFSRRMAEIQFHCCKDEHVSYASEYATCKYVIYVHSPALCQLEIFNPNPPLEPRKNIVCKPEAGFATNASSKRRLRTRDVLEANPIVGPLFSPSSDDAFEIVLQENVEDRDQSQRGDHNADV